MKTQIALLCLWGLGLDPAAAAQLHIVSGDLHARETVSNTGLGRQPFRMVVGLPQHPGTSPHDFTWSRGRETLRVDARVLSVASTTSPLSMRLEGTCTRHWDTPAGRETEQLRFSFAAPQGTANVPVCAGRVRLTLRATLPQAPSSPEPVRPAWQWSLPVGSVPTQGTAEPGC